MSSQPVPPSIASDPIPADPTCEEMTELTYESNWWRTVSERLARIVHRRAGGEAVDDVLQEVALAASRSERLPNAEPERKHFLVAITVRQSALWLRRRRRETEVHDKRILPGEVADRNDPVHFLMAQESHEQIRDCMAQLDDETRELLIKKIIHQLSYQAIAEQQGWTRHVAEYRVRGAKEKLRRLLIQTGLGEVE